jgi:rod shape determining protein RodA
VLLLVTILLAAYGVLMIYSANLGSLDPVLRNLWRRQATFGVAGVGLILLLAAFPRDYHWFGDLWWLAYLVAVVLLVLVLFFGQSEIGDVRAWFDLGFFNLQPSFVAMNLLTVSGGAMLSRLRRKRNPSAPLFGSPKTSLVRATAERPDVVNFLVSALMTLILAGLVFGQPDMGTAAVLVAIWLAMLLESDVKLRYIVLTAVLGLAAIVPLWQLMGALGFGYMRDRVLGFINPQGSPDIVYQIEQASIAIGSGGLWGKGLAQGTQSQLRYLPVRHTDFIFAVVAEELGFAGVMVLFVLYLVLFARLLRIMVIAPDAFGRLLATGALAIILFQVVINVGMNLGLLPVVGLPLPFVTYGPAALLTMMISIGLAENVVVRHRRLEF